jgi:hypothetical protein
VPIHVWSVLCGQAIVDAGNNLSLHTVIDEVNIALPAQLAPGGGVVINVNWQLVTMWRRANLQVGEQFNQRIEFVGPAGEHLLAPVDVNVNLGAHPRARVIAGVQLLAVNATGVYRFAISHSIGDAWEPVGRVFVDVQLHQPGGP